MRGFGVGDPGSRDTSLRLSGLTEHGELLFQVGEKLVTSWVHGGDAADALTK
jgi:hypothetical protein